MNSTDANRIHDAAPDELIKIAKCAIMQLSEKDREEILRPYKEKYEKVI